MAYLDKGISEASVSPEIEAALGFSQSEWLEDPMRWSSKFTPEDEASMERGGGGGGDVPSGKPLRSVYRVMARDGTVISFRVKQMVPPGRWAAIDPSAGVAGLDVTELQPAEGEFQEQRDLLSAILDTVGALVVVVVF